MKPQVVDRRTNVIVALNRFYHEHGLGEKGGEAESWAKVRLGWINFYIPNTASRKRALFFHDVHHLATGYQTDLRSEAEIGAWEIASGCRDFWAAWVLNYFGFLMGLVISPVRTFRAFVRGRSSLNLYHRVMTREEIDGSTIEEIRAMLHLDDHAKHPKLTDVLLFGMWSLPAIGFVLLLAFAVGRLF